MEKVFPRGELVERVIGGILALTGMVIFGQAWRGCSMLRAVDVSVGLGTGLNLCARPSMGLLPRGVSPYERTPVQLA